MVLENKSGFCLALGSKMLFLESERKNVCKSVVDDFIKGVCEYKGDSWIANVDLYLNDDGCRKDMAYRIQKANWELRETDNKHMVYQRIYGKDFDGGYDDDEVVFI